MADITIISSEVNYHRNGVSGEGFYAITFRANVDGEERNMLGVVFPPDEDEGNPSKWVDLPFHNPRVAVFDADVLPNAKFFENSWRGDHFAPYLYQAIKEYERAR